MQGILFIESRKLKYCMHASLQLQRVLIVEYPLAQKTIDAKIAISEFYFLF